jgi:ABC-2 type transport system permease protein
MSFIPLLGMVRKDLQLYFSDRRAVIMGFVVPIAVASFFGSLFGGAGMTEPARIPVALVDQDRSVISAAVLKGAEGDALLEVTTPSADDAREAVRRGTVSVAVLIPPGFGEQSAQAFFSGRERPSLTLLHDPSHSAEFGMVRGMLTQHVMQAVSQEVFSPTAGPALVDQALAGLGTANLPTDRRVALEDMLRAVQGFYQVAPAPGEAVAPAGFGVPYDTVEEAITAGTSVEYNGYAHSFAGMGVQFLLFAMIDLGVGILLERQRGLWKRLRSAPISRFTLLAGRAVSAAAIAVTILVVSFVFAGVVFGVRVEGSLVGFLAITVACSLMAATLGLLIAALGNTPGGSRGMASLVVLLMVMLGGAWVPTFVFPAWLQRVTVVMPTRWAIDGFDAMTWRGLGIEAAVLPTLILLAFAVAFGAVAVLRFRWEEA